MSGGQQITISQGVLTAQVDNDVSTTLVGQAANLATGILGPASALTLSGQAFAVSQGSLEGASEVEDLYIQFQIGSFVPEVSVTLVGQAIAMALGVLSGVGPVVVLGRARGRALSAGGRRPSQLSTGRRRP